MCVGGKKSRAAAAQNAAGNAALLAEARDTSSKATEEAASQTDKLIADQQSAIDKALADQEARNQELIAGIQSQNQTALQTMTDTFTATLADSQGAADKSGELVTSMLTQIREQQAAAKADLEAAKRNTGQKPRKANLGELYRQNKLRMSKGQSSTAQSGPGGIGTSALPLGRATLLGA